MSKSFVGKVVFSSVEVEIWCDCAAFGAFIRFLYKVVKFLQQSKIFQNFLEIFMSYRWRLFIKIKPNLICFMENIGTLIDSCFCKLKFQFNAYSNSRNFMKEVPQILVIEKNCLVLFLRYWSFVFFSRNLISKFNYFQGNFFLVTCDPFYAQ